MAGLANGTRFPHLEMAEVGGGVLALPERVEGQPAVVLAYRGAWCARCNAQLASFQDHLPQFVEAGIGVVAFSTDPESEATAMVQKHGLTFPVGYGVGLGEVAPLLQAYVNEERGALEATNFLLRPDGTIEIAVYSSSSIGRLLPNEVLEIVALRRSRWAASEGAGR